ncbi:DUF493 family protein [Piscinibacter sp. Jin2]|uniref:UPF0250 protein JI742_03140 n=1 Tax=Aquariibacter lacus TaxID=2801332 RepID=A0A9X1BMY8_9BURK|nr:DUF493 family protein [Piscinibacter lacus]MBL0718877.1 DUF493 family protein [Piscinibacter lacus]
MALPEPPESAVPPAGRPSLIDYPCAFPIKVMGLDQPGYREAMVALARQFDPGFDEASVEQRPSRGGRYLGLTLTLQATSREQLDAAYRAFSGHPLVKVVL